MKKILLSLVVIISFGVYSFFLKSGYISAQLSRPQSVPVELADDDGENNTLTEDTTSITSTAETKPTVTRNIDCVFIPYDDYDDDEEEYEDDDEDQKGHYKCTTIIVDSPATTKPAPVTPAPTKNPTPVVATPPPATDPKSNTKWKNGTFIGDVIDATYGNVQISATFSNDRLTNVSFLDYPQDRSTSLQKSNYAIPILKREAISSQSAKVNVVSGVTYTSKAFMKSLSSAIIQATI